MKPLTNLKLVFAMMLVALLHLTCSGYSADRDSLTEVDRQVFSRLCALADQGNTDAQCRLADLYLWGWGTEADEAMAWELFQQAARGGSARAMNRIGAMYEQGIYVEQDYKKALQWHIRSAALGYAPAQSDAGHIYEDGLAGQRDINVALSWYEKAARQGEPFAVEALQRFDKQAE